MLKRAFLISQPSFFAQMGLVEYVNLQKKLMYIECFQKSSHNSETHRKCRSNLLIFKALTEVFMLVCFADKCFSLRFISSKGSYSRFIIVSVG